MKNRLAVILTLLSFLLSGCFVQAASSPPVSHSLQPSATVHEAGESIEIQLGFTNNGRNAYPSVENLGAVWDLTMHPGDLRAGGEVHMMGEIAPSETFYPVNWEGQLDPGAYRLTWGAPSIGSTVVTFTASQTDGRYQIDDVEQWMGTTFPAPEDVSLIR